MKKTLYFLLLIPFVVNSQSTYPCCTYADVIDNIQTKIDLDEGWHLIGATNLLPIETTEAFAPYIQDIVIVKDNEGLVYLPEFNFHNLDSIRPGLGYQIKISEPIDDFVLNVTIPPVYGCLDCNACNFNFFATSFLSFSCEYAEDGFDCDDNLLVEVGDIVQGGYVFYVNESQTGALICAPEFNSSADLTFSNFYCDNSIHGGYDDWYLPSSSELQLLCNQVGAQEEYIEGMYPLFGENPFYWSSDVDLAILHTETCEIVTQSQMPQLIEWAVFKYRPIRVIGNITYGCTNSTAINYNPSADIDDNSCE